MKIRKLLLFIPSILIAAGCAHDEQRTARYDNSLYSGSPYLSSGASSSRSSSTSSAGQEGNYSSSPSTSYSPGTGQSASMDDGILARQIQQSLAQDPTIVVLLPSLQIAPSGGVVNLSGQVGSQELKDRIESKVKQTPGVTSVNNHLEVASESAAAQSNGSLAATSDQSTTTSNQVDTTSEQISPTSRTNSESTIYAQTNAPDQSSLQPQQEPLSATSSRSDQSSQTYESTNSATGTSSSSGQYSTGQSGAVNVNVSGNSATDRTLAQQISQELRADAGLASAISQVSISVADGKVSLRGNVKSDQQKQQIESAIQRITGVASVDNQLRVSADQTTPMNQ